jgi:carbamoyltransferase
MLVIGINVSHDPSVIANLDGNILAAAEEDKLRQIKGYRGFPYLAMKWVLGQIPRLDSFERVHVAFGCQDISEFIGGHVELVKFFGKKPSLKYLMLDLCKFVFSFIDFSESLQRLLEKLTSLHLHSLGVSSSSMVEFHYINHHLAHALSASSYIADGPLIVVTADGKGDGLSATFSFKEHDKIVMESKLEISQSIGQIYSAVTEALGFISKRHEGKITGLSALGNPYKFESFLHELCGTPYEFLSCQSKVYDSLNKIPFPRLAFMITRNIFNISDIKDLFKFSMVTRDTQLFALGRIKYRKIFTDYIQSNNMSREDVAAGVQKYAQEVLLCFLERIINNRAISKIALAGGVFANVRINQEILAMKGVEDVFVQPAMHDAGTAIGASFAIEPMKRGTETKTPNLVYLGPSFKKSDYMSACEDYKFNLSKKEVSSNWIAEEIVNGKIIAVFNGSTEWGPRALGNRSILASCTDRHISQELNSRLNRSDFMPFAPFVLDQDAPLILENYKSEMLAAKFMTCTFTVKKEFRNKLAVVHVDNTVRPQIVSESDNLLIYQILKSVKKHTGLGICINTSFNLHEYPIVNSPKDAIRVLAFGAVDYLLFEGRLVLK